MQSAHLRCAAATCGCPRIGRGCEADAGRNNGRYSCGEDGPEARQHDLAILEWRCCEPLKSRILSSGSNDWSREMNLKNLKTRLKKLEQTKRKITIEAECICFPPDEPPALRLPAEIEAARAVLCPIHGRRFSNVARDIYRPIYLPEHLESVWRRWRSAQYIKAMDASFPPTAGRQRRSWNRMGR